MASLRKALERQQRREHLLNAAARVFGRRPFDEATMQEVAAEAQIGMQGLYEHFPSKQDLYEQVMLQRAQVFQKRAEEVLQGRGTPLERLRGLATVYVEQFSDQPWRLSSFLRDRLNFDWGVDTRFMERLRAVYQRERDHLKGLLAEAVACGQVRPLDPEFLTQLCLEVLQASLHFHHHHANEEEVRACVDRALDCLLQGVGVRS